MTWARRVAYAGKKLHNSINVIRKNYLIYLLDTYNLWRVYYRKLFMGIISKYLVFFQVYHYLIDWDGWPISPATWETWENVTQDIIATYEAPEIKNKRRVEETAVYLFVTIQKRLTSTGCTPFEVSMPLDVFRHCCGQKGTPLLFVATGTIFWTISGIFLCHLTGFSRTLRWCWTANRLSSFN